MLSCTDADTECGMESDKDNDAHISLPAAPVPFRSYSSPSFCVPPYAQYANSRRSGASHPLLSLSDDEDDEQPDSRHVTAASHAAAAFPSAAVQSFRQLRVSDTTARSSLLAHSSSRFHPYNRQPLPPDQPTHYQQSASQPSSPPSTCYSTLPLPLSTSFSSTALSALPQPSPLSSFDLRSFPSTPATSSFSAVGYHSHRLPVVSSLDSVAFVSCECVADLLSDVDGACARFGFSRVRLIDCRFQYEYDGGHIRGAEWLTDHTDLDGLLAPSMQQHSQSPSPSPRAAATTAATASTTATAAERAGPLLECVILHCEFSRHRAPSVYRAVRRRDRELNGIERFPSLYLPELYVMHSGYASFHSSHPQLCEPESGAYVSMLDRRYQYELKRDWKQRKCGGFNGGPSKHLMAAPFLTRATSESSALNYSIGDKSQQQQQQQGEDLLGHHIAQSLSPQAVSPFSPFSGTAHPSSVSSFQLPPPLHLSGPGGSMRTGRRGQPDGESRLLRSASCAALRQPLTFRSLNSSHQHSGESGDSSSKHTTSQRDAQPTPSASDAYRSIYQRRQQQFGQQTLLPSSHDSVHSAMSASEDCASRQDMDASVLGLFSSSPADHTAAPPRAALLVQQLLAL